MPANEGVVRLAHPVAADLIIQTIYEKGQELSKYSSTELIKNKTLFPGDFQEGRIEGFQLAQCGLFMPGIEGKK